MNNYGNAEPKILKTLNSSGQVLNDSGEVISDTSDYWEKVYNEAEPKPDKILHSDGTIKDSAGNLIQDTTEFNVKKYTQAEPIPAKYLHADGTIDENSGSGGGQVNAYCWGDNNLNFFTDFLSAPDSAPSDDYYFLIGRDNGSVNKVTWEDAGFNDYDYEKVDDSTIKLTSIDDPTEVFTFTRLSDNDFTIW